MDVNPQSRPARPTPLFPRRTGGEGALLGVMAIMSFLACLTLALALGAARVSAAWERGLTGQATVQIVDVEGVAMEVQAAGALQVLKSTPGIAAARTLSRAESEALLKPWLGDADLTIVPVPVLIAVTLDVGVPLDGDDLRRRLTAVAPGATLDDHSRWNEGLTSASAMIAWAAYGVLALTALAAAASVIFAARAALQAHREVVDVLHMTGAGPGFIAGQVQWRFFRLGGGAGLAGMAGAVAFLVLAGALSGLSSYLPAVAPRWSDGLWLLLVPAGAAVLAMVTARTTVARFLSHPA